MIKSMTGFSKIEIENPEGKLYGEARSLNNRYLEINIRLPRNDYSCEQKLREIAKRYLKRGKIDFVIKWEKPEFLWNPPKLNEGAVKQYKKLIQMLQEKFGIKDNLTIDNLLHFRDIIVYEENNNNIPEDTLIEAFESLLVNLDKERTREGRLIQRDLSERLKNITKNVNLIEKRWPAIIKDHKKRLQERVMEVTKATSIDEVRVLQEIAIYMEKVDISEEIVRLKGHLGNFKGTFNSTDAVGRKFDFIIQEMVRETNTIGSKSNDLKINEMVVQIKVDIEKIREQIQNVE